MASSLPLDVNGGEVTVTVDDPAMPLLYVLRENLELRGPRFGCGLGQCGSCMVLLDGEAVLSCEVKLSAVGAGKIVTLEGLGSPDQPSPVQQAFIDEQAAQCGYCLNGVIIRTVALPAKIQESERGRDQEGARRQSLPLRHPSAHDPRGAARGPQRVSGRKRCSMPSPLAETSWGALVISFGLAGGIALGRAQEAAAAKTVQLKKSTDFSLSAPMGRLPSIPEVDVGTGVRTALTQIVAEELDLPIDRINVIRGDTGLTPDEGPTFGSLSIQNGGMQIRQAAATARKALMEISTQRLGVPAAELSISTGTVTGAGKSISYGELVGGRIFARKLDKDAPVKDPASYMNVGKSVPRLDIRGKATGRFTYMHDFRIAGMLHGRVVRPPAIGAKLESVDESSVKDVPGLVA